jgi:hypothetical protein
MSSASTLAARLSFQSLSMLSSEAAHSLAPLTSRAGPCESLRDCRRLCAAARRRSPRDTTGKLKNLKLPYNLTDKHHSFVALFKSGESVTRERLQPQRAAGADECRVKHLLVGERS